MMNLKFLPIPCLIRWFSQMEPKLLQKVTGLNGEKRYTGYSVPRFMELFPGGMEKLKSLLYRGKRMHLMVWPPVKR